MFQGHRTYLESFPTDANVRLVVEGLAYCRLKPNQSTIYFLKNVPHHQLRLEIYRRHNIIDKPELLANYPKDVDVESSIHLSCQLATPAAQTQIEEQQQTNDTNEIFAEPENNDGDFQLRRLINLPYYHKKYHGAEITETPNLTLTEKPTELIVENFKYYTLELTLLPHTLLDVDNSAVLEQKLIGYSLGGKALVDNTGTTITIGSESPIRLPSNETGKDWYYDIIFSNHCSPNEHCPEPPHDDLDFKYYYEVLAEKGNENAKFKLISFGEPTDKVGACNVVILEPPLEP